MPLYLLQLQRHLRRRGRAHPRGGPAFADFIASQTVAVRALSCPTMEGAETHSMSMEFLTAPWHHPVLWGADRQVRALPRRGRFAVSSPTAAWWTTSRRRVYRHPEMTPRGAQPEVGWSWRGRYRPYINFDGLPLLRPGRRLAAAAAHLPVPPSTISTTAWPR